MRGGLLVGKRTALLAETLYRRMFENDLFSSSSSASSAVMWALAALATPGVMFSGSQYYFYAHARTFSPEVQDRIIFVSQAFHVDFAMAMAGLVTMLVWTSLSPDRRDALVLGPLPVTAGEQARARLLALFRFFLMFATAVSVPTAFAFTFVTIGDAAVAELPLRVAGHIAATLSGAAFVFFLAIDVQLILAAVLGPRAVTVATWPLQTGAVLGMVAAVAATGGLADALLAAAATHDPRVVWNPAAWFVGVYRWTIGDERAVFGMLAARAVLASGIVMGVAVLAYPRAYQRCLANAIATEGRRATWWSGALARVWLRILSPWLRTPLERGLATFITATLMRSHAHRFLIGSYLGMGVLLALPLLPRLLQSGSVTTNSYAWFAVPLNLVCWSAAALRVAMMLPIEPSANWIFKLTEPVDKARMLSSAVTVTQGIVIAPLAVVFGAAAGLNGGSALGVTVLIVVLTAGNALVEALMLHLRAVPGTCTYRPGQLRLRVMWPVYFAVWIAVAYVLPRLATASVGELRSTFILTGGLALVWSILRAWRVSRAKRVIALVFEEIEPAAATIVRLGPA